MGSAVIKRSGRIEPIMSGVREILNGPGVQSMLTAQTARAAARCNAMMDPQMRHAGGEYTASSKRVKNVTCGRVGVGGREDGKFAHIDNHRNNTLKKGCGV